MSKLLPCPFCGGEAHYTKEIASAGLAAVVMCSDNDCCTNHAGTLQEAIAAWNTRPAPARCDELVTTSSINGTLLVTRQNAEEVIAAKDARIEELEGHFAEMTRSCLAERDRNKALEADNKRLREALEPFADVADLDIGDDEDDRAVFWPISNERFSLARRLRVGDLRRASEALGEAAASPLGEKKG